MQGPYVLPFDKQRESREAHEKRFQTNEDARLLHVRVELSQVGIGARWKVEDLLQREGRRFQQ